MLSLDQIKLLESKVEKAIAMIQKLTEERNALKITVVEKNKRISELENLVVTVKDDQTKIEAGVLNALDLLSAFEDSNTTAKVIKSTGVEQPKQMTQKEKDLADILGSGEHHPDDDSEKQMDIF